MMLVVVANIVSQDVQRAIIAVRLLVEAIPYIMLSDEVTRTWMQTSGEEAREEQV